MRVSVIVPTRNRAAMLANALAGISAQSHPDIELIVVDDGSAPEEAARNAALTQAVAGARHVVLPPLDAQGSGPSRVRNAGIAAATGDLIAFCDDDDVWCARDFLATAVAAFAAQPGLDLLFANQEAVSGDKTLYTVWQPLLERALETRAAAAGALVAVTQAECLVAAGDFAHLNTCVLRRPLVDALAGFQPDLRYCEDLDFYVRAVDRARAVACLRRTVSIHNVPDPGRQDNASTRMNERQRKLALHQIASRLVMACETPSALRYARRLGADACRHLARQAATQSLLDEALTWARLGSGWQSTPRWTVYTQWLRWQRARSARRSPAG
jgi:glycosyltransferase involved in cell wall biosynthesis